MSQPRSGRSSTPSREPRRSPPGRSLLPLFSAIAIGAILIGLLAAFLPALLSSDGDEPPVELPVTPGGEEAALRDRVNQNPDDVDAMVMLANLLANTGRRDEAIQWFEQAVERRPDDPALRIAFGLTLLRSGHTLDAELQLKRAIELAPEDPEPRFLLAQLYEAADPPRTEEANDLYRQVIEIAPDSVYADQARAALNPAATATPTP